MRFSISHVLYFAFPGRKNKAVTIYLQLYCLFVLFFFQTKSAPTIVWVARSRGLPRSTDGVSHIASSLWHFQGYLSIAEALACFPAVTPKSTLAYGFAKHEHYRHHSLCEHGLSSACKSKPRSPENYKSV